MEEAKQEWRFGGLCEIKCWYFDERNIVLNKMSDTGLKDNMLEILSKVDIYWLSTLKGGICFRTVTMWCMNLK